MVLSRVTPRHLTSALRGIYVLSTETPFEGSHLFAFLCCCSLIAVYQLCGINQLISFIMKSGNLNVNIYLFVFRLIECFDGFDGTHPFLNEVEYAFCHLFSASIQYFQFTETMMIQAV